MAADPYEIFNRMIAAQERTNELLEILIDALVGEDEESELAPRYMDEPVQEG
jgi:hypothetical protein